MGGGGGGGAINSYTETPEYYRGGCTGLGGGGGGGAVNEMCNTHFDQILASFK